MHWSLGRHVARATSAPVGRACSPIQARTSAGEASVARFPDWMCRLRTVSRPARLPPAQQERTVGLAIARRLPLKCRAGRPPGDTSADGRRPRAGVVRPGRRRSGTGRRPPMTRPYRRWWANSLHRPRRAAGHRDIGLNSDGIRPQTEAARHPEGTPARAGKSPRRCPRLAASGSCWPQFPSYIPSHLGLSVSVPARS